MAISETGTVDENTNYYQKCSFHLSFVICHTSDIVIKDKTLMLSRVLVACLLFGIVAVWAVVEDGHIQSKSY